MCGVHVLWCMFGFRCSLRYMCTCVHVETGGWHQCLLQSRSTLIFETESFMEPEQLSKLTGQWASVIHTTSGNDITHSFWKGTRNPNSRLHAYAENTLSAGTWCWLWGLGKYQNNRIIYQIIDFFFQNVFREICKHFEYIVSWCPKKERDKTARFLETMLFFSGNFSR